MFPNILEWLNIKFRKKMWINDGKTEKIANRLISDGQSCIIEVLRLRYKDVKLEVKAKGCNKKRLSLKKRI